MSSYRTEREDFIAAATKYGMPLDVARLLLREATGLNRRAELACSSEAADRDRVKCPAWAKGDIVVLRGEEKRYKTAPCLCDQETYINPETQQPHPTIKRHTKITRITLQDWQSERRIQRAIDALNAEIVRKAQAQDVHQPENVAKWRVLTSGDPRGYTLRVIPPAYAEENAGRAEHDQRSIGVPSGPSGLRW